MTISISVEPRIPGYEDMIFEVKGILTKVDHGWTWDEYEIYHWGDKITDLLLDRIRDKILDVAETNTMENRKP